MSELKAIELENNLGPDINGVEHRVPWLAYDKDEADKYIAELKQKLNNQWNEQCKDIEEMRGQHQMLKRFGHYKLSPVPGYMINHDKREYVSYNVVCLIINHLEAENESLKASAYADGVDAGMRERRLKRALWIARANRSIEKIALFKLWNASVSTMNPEDGARQEYDKWKKNLGKFLKKAEEYK